MTATVEFGNHQSKLTSSSARRGLKSSRGGSCSFPTEEIMHAQCFNFAFK